jgi:hypothetical protein
MVPLRFTRLLALVLGVTPTEAALDGQDMAIQVDYDAEDRVANSVILKQK